MQKSHQLWLCSRPVLTHLHPTPPCSSVSWWGTQRALRCRTPGDDGGSEPSFPMKDSNCVLSQFALFMDDRIFKIGHFLLFFFFFFGSNGHRTATTVVVFKSRSTELSFLVPAVNCRSRCRLVPKAVRQTFEALLDRFPPAIILIHQGTTQWVSRMPSPYQTFCRREQVWP